MTLQECYTAMGGNYDDAIGRLRSERLVQKFVLKFLNDGSYDLLCRSLEEKNRLQESSSRLCESLRNGYTPQADALAEEVRVDYAQTVAAIQAFQKESAG